MTELIGRIIDHYRLEAMLGDGGMGSVYRAYDLNLDRPVALKIMHPHYARRAEFRARLRQEAKTLASLDHPSIVRVLDFGEEDDLAYITMEYISGGSLRAHLQRLQQRQQFLPIDQSLQIGAQIADALHYAHQRGLIHRDVKPSNIILKRLSRADEPGEQPFRAVLTDFGLVKLLQGNSLTQSGTTLGTPAYMSPEQCEGLELDGRSDIYSLGVVLYELLTNRLPFHFGSLAEAIAAHMRGDMPTPIREWRPEVPSVVESLVERALAKDPDDRFASAEAMATDLRSAIYAMSDTPTQVLPGATQEPVPQADDVGEFITPEAANELPQGYRLVIETPGYETTEVALIQPQITLGRDSDNDIVLPAEGVSRYHARLQATTSGWSIVDLGGVNGTRINGERIPVGKAVSLHPDDAVQLGPYQLTLSAPAYAAQEEALPVAERPTPAPQVRVPESPLALFLARDRVAVGPGEEAEFHLEIANRGPVDDRITIDVEGLPEGWVQAPMEFIPVPAGETIPLTIRLHPPRQTNMPAGRQRFRIQLRSQQYPEATPAVTASMMLGALESFEASVTPQQLRVPGMLEVSLRNTGNAAAVFSVVGHDPENKLIFHGEQGRVRLEPQQRATIELEVEPRQQQPFSSTEAYPFGVEVASRSGSRQLLSAEGYIPPLIPAW
ncbi:MAG TPA: protein kinase, partial [Candidatus Binatia bacterium]|nr:protein kinase [Candidatus Binatia bacterium]